MPPIFCTTFSTRRYAELVLGALVPLLGLLLGSLSGCATMTNGAEMADAAPKCSPSELVYVGSDGDGLQALRFDACAGKLAALGSVAALQKPRWSVAHPTLPLLYVASDKGAKDGEVLAFSINHESGALSLVNEVSAGGAGTTHLWLDVPSMTVLAANFGTGSTSSIAVNADGSLGALVATVQSTGSGPTRRQTSPHAHGVLVDPSGRYALVADLGADRIFVDGFDRATHALQANDPIHARAFAAPSGSGPHHIAFGADGHFVYLLNELSADLMTLRWNASRGALTTMQSLPISSDEFSGAKSGSELAVSRDGRFVYVADRGESRLLVYRVDPFAGTLSLVQRVASGGERPWTFAIHPSGEWMLVANSKKLSLFRIDAASGQLSDTRQSLDAATPLSITFVH